MRIDIQWVRLAKKLKLTTFILNNVWDLSLFLKILKVKFVSEEKCY